MADARDEGVWTRHAEEHKTHNLHAIQPQTKLRLMLLKAAPKGGKVIDFGCGSGLWSPMFEDYEYTGLDQNANMISVANSRNTGLKFQQIEWNKIPLEDSSVDVIFTSAVLQHNKHDQKLPVLREFYRVLKPGGIYLATENTFRPDNCHVSFKGRPFDNEMDDGYSFTAKGWTLFMDREGFALNEYSAPSEYIWRSTK